MDVSFIIFASVFKRIITLITINTASKGLGEFNVTLLWISGHSNVLSAYEALYNASSEYIAVRVLHEVGAEKIE